MLAVKILVQAVVVPRFVLKKQWCGSCLACLGTAGEKLGMLSRVAHSNTERLIPAVRDRRQPGVKGGPNPAYRVRQRVREIFVFPAPEAMPAHHDTAPETAVLR